MLRLRTAATSSILAAAMTMALGSGAARGPDAVEPAVEIGPGFSPAQVETIDWALGLYAEAGLDLPPIELRHHATPDACNGARGLHVPGRPRSTVHICTSEGPPVAEWLVLHEIAHAWDAHALDDGRRAELLALRGLDRWWDDGVVPWHTLGAEHAAQILVWGLIDRPIRIGTIPGTSCDELHAGYLLLTGSAPLHGYRELCEP